MEILEEEETAANALGFVQTQSDFLLNIKDPKSNQIEKINLKNIIS